MNGNGIVLMPTRAMDRKFAAPERDIDYVLDRRDALATVLGALPPLHESAVRLFYFSDLAAPAVAERLGTASERVSAVLEDAEAMMQGLARTCFRHLCVNGGAG